MPATGKKKRVALILAAFAALAALAGVARATTRQLSPLNCSVTAYGVARAGSTYYFTGGTSCGSPQTRAQKDLTVCARFYSFDGLWHNYPGGCTTYDTKLNPARATVTMQGASAGLRVRVWASATDSYGGRAVGADVYGPIYTIP